MTQSPKHCKPSRIWLRYILVTFGVLMIALAAYAGYTVYHANFRAVVSGKAYRSGQMNVEQLTRAIQDYGIKSILNLRGENSGATWYQAEVETAAKRNVIHYDLSLDSGEDLTLEQMNDLVTLLRAAPKPILIHCLGGADRSGLVSALFEFAIEDQPPKEAAREFSIWCGHVPLIRPQVLAMDRSFWGYVSNRLAAVNPRFQPTPVSP